MSRESALSMRRVYLGIARGAVRSARMIPSLRAQSLARAAFYRGKASAMLLTATWGE